MTVVVMRVVVVEAADVKAGGHEHVRDDLAASQELSCEDGDAVRMATL